MSIWLFIWRFQPIHLGHISAIIQLLDLKLDRVVIGIGSSNVSMSQDNPFSYDERYALVQESITKHFPQQDIEIISLSDKESDELRTHYIMDAIHPTIVMSGNPWTRRCFEDIGVRVIEPSFDHAISATQIRKAWRENRLYTVTNFLDNHVVEFLNSYQYNG